MSLLRPVAEADHDAILHLNERHVELLAPLSHDRLLDLLGWADTGAVIDVDGALAGFVLTFASGSAYDGENFAWFSERYADFCYLDRVVVDDDFRRRGLATQVYDELEGGCGRPLFCLEVNSDPPNEPSLAFHRRRGFVDLTERGFAGHRVTMMAKSLPTTPLPGPRAD
jgi:predicted GNAT superfamily acetyltransferase